VPKTTEIGVEPHNQSARSSLIQGRVTPPRQRLCPSAGGRRWPARTTCRGRSRLARHRVRRSWQNAAEAPSSAAVRPFRSDHSCSRPLPIAADQCRTGLGQRVAEGHRAATPNALDPDPGGDIMTASGGTDTTDPRCALLTLRRTEARRHGPDHRAARRPLRPGGRQGRTRPPRSGSDPQPRDAGPAAGGRRSAGAVDVRVPAGRHSYPGPVDYPWMHRVDISLATDRPRHLTHDHDGVLVDDVVTE